MDIDTHPNPQPNLHHRKIDLQSHHDLTYLQTNLAKSALQKLDLHFPKISKPATHISLDGPINTTTTTDSQSQTTRADAEDKEEADEDEDEDPMRRRVHDLITHFLQTTWQTAAPNIAVNGTNASTLPLHHTATLSAPPASRSFTHNSDAQRQSQEEQEQEQENVHFQYAPFDASLQHRLASLHGELEALTAQVSKLRRTAPGEGAETYARALRDNVEREDELFHQAQQEDQEAEIQGLRFDEMRSGWNEDVREVYERGVAELAGLAGTADSAGGGVNGSELTLTETVGKAQRARRVAMELD